VPLPGDESLVRGRTWTGQGNGSHWQVPREWSLRRAGGYPEGDRVRDAYGTEKYERLVRLKDRDDPHNLFHLNQNIRPSRDAGTSVAA